MMTALITHTKIRLAAVDLDGTLLGPDTMISPDNRAAIARLHAAGIEVVLASGRHYESMIPYAERLPEVRWIVSSQGAEVATVDRSQVLGSRYLSESTVRSLVGAEVSRGLSPVYYSEAGVFTTAEPNVDLDFYAELSGRKPVLTARDDVSKMRLQKVLWVGGSQPITALRQDQSFADLGLQRVQTNERFFEFMPMETTKAAALQNLTDHLGLTAENVVAFGDGENDIPMFEWAGLSFAMSHGWKNALAKAKWVTPDGPEENAFARGVEQLMTMG